MERSSGYVDCGNTRPVAVEPTLRELANDRAPEADELAAWLDRLAAAEESYVSAFNSAL